MEKPKIIKQDTHKCVKCHEPLEHFIAYIPSEGEVCLKCFAEYAQSEENL